jgi:hypothetical protein
MRALVWVAALAVMTGAGLAKSAQKPAAPAKGEPTWIAICRGEDAQYTQTINGPGFFHVGNGDRTYQTQKLVQSHFDGTTVCAVPDPKAPRASTDIALICADNGTKTVSVMYASDKGAKPVKPANAQPYCQARIDVLK